MQTRRDHLQAYQFATSRLASALVSGDAVTDGPPMRRSKLGAVFGYLIALLLIIVALVYGLLRPVAQVTWNQPGSLIVEKETGIRYVFLRGVLRPTANYSSALLLLGSGAPVEGASRTDLTEVPHGSTIGIPGAPNDLPQPTGLLTGAWTYCLHPGSASDHVLDFAPRNTRPIPDDGRILLSGPGGTTYVLWRGTKYPVRNHPSLIALGLDTQRPVTASGPWLDGLPTGGILSPAAIPGAGTTGARVAGSPARVGQVFQTSVGGVSHFYVLKADGMAPMSATESALVDAAGHRPRQVSPADIAAVPTSSDTSLLHRLPDLLGGRDATGGAALCLLQSIDAKGLHSSVVRETGIVAAPGSGVLIPPGTGLLAALPQSRPGSADGDIYLITEQGVKYPLADDQAVQALGYSSTAARPLPAYVLDLLRTGPRLSRVQAAVAVGGAS